MSAASADPEKGVDQQSVNSTGGEGVAPPARPEGTRARRRWYFHWGWVLVGGGVLLFIALAILPPVLSTDTARDMILARVNRNLNGRLTVRDWSLGWFTGVAMRDVQFDDAGGKAVFTARTVIVSADIPGLIREKKRFRTILVDHPKLRLALGSDGRIRLPVFEKAAASAPAGEAGEPETPEPLPIGFDVRSGLIVREGTLTIAPEDGGPPLVVTGIEAGAQIHSLLQPALFNARFLIADAGAPVAVEGNVTVIPEGATDARQATGEVAMRMKEFRLAALTPATSRMPRPFNPGGTADVDVRVRFRGAHGIHTTLRLDARDVTLSAGAAAAAPRIPRLMVDCDVAHTGSVVRFDRFKIESAMADVDAAGEVTTSAGGGAPTGRVSGKLRVDLARLGEFFPHVLDMPEGLAVKGGTLTASGEASRGSEETRVRLEAKLERLDLAVQDRRLILDQPVTVTLDGERTKRGARVERFVLTSPWLKATAWGTAADFECHLVADVTKLAGEAAKFAELHGVSAQGRAEAHLRVASSGAPVRRVETTLDLKDFNLTGLTRRPLEFRNVRLTGSANAEFDAAGGFVAARDVKAALAAPAVNVSLSAARVTPDSQGRRLPEMRGGELVIEGDLTQALALAHGSGTLPSAIEVKGGFRLRSDVEAAGGVLRAGSLDATLGELAFAIMDQRVVEPKITLRARDLALTPETRSLSLREAELGTSWATTRLDGVNVPDWAAFPKGAALRARMDLNLDRVKEILRRVGLLPTRFDVQGQVQAGVDLTPAAEAPRLKVSLVATDLKLMTESDPPVDEKRVSIDLDGLRRDEAGLSAENVTVASTFFSLSGKGRLDDASVPPRIEGEGSLVLDLDRLGPVLARMLRRPLSMSGRHAGPFKVSTVIAPGGWGQWLRGTQGQASLRADRVEAYGIEATDLAAVLRDDLGVVDLNVRGKVNGGAMATRLVLDAKADPPLLHAPEAGVLFSEARLSTEALAGALARMDPLFAGGSAPQGTMTVTLGEFATPMPPPPRAATAASGALALKGVSFVPGALLRQILVLAQRGEPARVQLPDQSIVFSLRDGVLRHSPLTFRASAVTLRAESVKLRKGDIECTVEVPCTLDLAGRDRAVYERMKDEVFRLRIGGVVEKPVADLKAFQDDVAARVAAVRAKLARERAAQELDRAVDDLFRIE